jgi:hypothetical protein
MPPRQQASHTQLQHQSCAATLPFNSASDLVHEAAQPNVCEQKHSLIKHGRTTGFKASLAAPRWLSPWELGVGLLVAKLFT